MFQLNYATQQPIVILSINIKDIRIECFLRMYVNIGTVNPHANNVAASSELEHFLK